MNPNVGKTTFILFFHKMNGIVFRYKLGLIHLTPIPHVLKILVVLLDSGFSGYNLHFFIFTLFIIVALQTRLVSYWV